MDLSGPSIDVKLKEKKRKDCLELASPRKNSSKTGEFSGFFRNFCFGVFIAIFFGRRVANFRQKKETAMYALSQLGTRVSKVYR
jgi:hypothetical protein